MVRNSFKALILAAALSFGISGAHAAAYDFSFATADYSVSGELTTSGNQVTSITGSLTGNGLVNEAISLFTGSSPYTYPGGGGATDVFDQLFFTTQPFVTSLGVVFTADAFLFTVYSHQNGSSFDYFLESNQNGFRDPLFIPGELITSGTITAVPGPTVGAGASSFALAAIFLGWLMRRRGQQLA
jgi:hypothetical protein